MATKTVVCPECGSPAAPGRYACAECGSLLASVAPGGRELTPDSATAHGATVAAVDQPDVAAIDGSGDALTAEAEPVAEPATIAPGAATDVGTAIEPESAFEPDETGWDEVAAGEPTVAGDAFDENAPLESAPEPGPGWHPPVLNDVTPPEEPVGLGQTATAEAAPAAPSWPPPGDLGPIARPEPRTPAGAYLPPSAILPALDAPWPSGSAPALAGQAAAATATVETTPEAGSRAASPAGRGATAWTNAVDSIRVPALASRRAVTIGAGLAAVGILLPWLGSLPGANPFAGYLDRWGLAGAGLWIVLLGLVALIVVASSSGRAASWPVGLPAVATATFLVGLVWPYLVGGSRAIGVWVIVVGAIVLGVGGLLGMRRHGGPEPAV
jgi:hypothetical protein